MITKKVFNFIPELFNYFFGWMPGFVQIIMGILIIVLIILAIKRIIV